MKKIYFSPVMDVIELKHQQTLLAGSVEVPILEDSTIDADKVDSPTFSDDSFIDFAE